MLLKRWEQAFLLLIIMLFFVGNRFTSIVNLLAIVVIYLYILIQDKETALYLLFFLIPNIRIADNIGFSGFINIAFLLVAVKWILAKMRKINKYGLMLAVLALAFSLIHIVIYDNYISYIVEAINIFVNILVMICILGDKCESLSVEKIVRYLSLGVISSMAVYILANASSISSVFSSNLRLNGYGDDPNYYSIYLLVSIALILNKIKEAKGTISDIIIVLLLTLMGLLTSSKMFILCCAVLVICFVIAILRHFNVSIFKSIMAVIIAGGVALIIQRDNIIYLFEKVIDRFSNLESSGASFLYALTTGRSKILEEYWKIFWGDLSTCLFGKGLMYNKHLAPLFGDTRVAHNTYFDWFLCWGLIGGIILFVLMFKFIKQYTEKQRLLSYSCMPLYVFLATIFSLSCLTADMFWYILLLVLLPFKKSQI